MDSNPRPIGQQASMLHTESARLRWQWCIRSPFSLTVARWQQLDILSRQFSK